ncbi:MAG: site-2 protease family protein [Treponema sp.]|jgi:regulator of sigma E protease|nr:site-2 protease family protein [Treponema sp.]
MIFVKIILGVIGLGVVVFVHELGHFLAARLVGIEVEAFSIGWGNPILKKKIGKVEYRLGMFPLGGYCKMRGENEFQEAWENGQRGLSPAKGDYLGASPQRRILVAFAGPFFNLVFAVLTLSVIWGAGFDVRTLGNRIVLISEIHPGEQYPADEAGLKTGDRIIEIDGKKIQYYHEVQENIAVNPEKLLSVTVERNGEQLRLNVTPSLDKSSGAGKIGVYFWTDPLIEAIAPESPAALGGLLPGDRIERVDGRPVSNSMDFLVALEPKPAALTIDYARNDEKGQASLIPEYGDDGEANLGITWTSIQYRTPPLSPFAALAKGAAESWKTLVVSLRSLRLLFKGIDLTQAVSGPVRITYMMGDVAAEGFGQSFGVGLRSMADFLALISVALCVMNLLPLPILDGGMIVLFLFEMIRRKPVNPRAVAVFQTLGVVLIFGLMILAIFGDILYLARR